MGPQGWAIRKTVWVGETMVFKSLYIYLCLMLCASAHAQEADWRAQIQTHYDQGQFIQAAKLAEVREESAALSFAARSYLASIMIAAPEERSQDIVRVAEALAEQAIDRDPENVEARVQLAVATGLIAQNMSGMKAHSTGLGKKVKTVLESALEINPDDPWALSVLGGWHMEVSRKGGSLAAGWLYKASRDEGMRLLERAMFVRPFDIPIRQRYAMLLTATKAPKLQERALQVLDRAVILRPRDAYEQAMLVHCKTLFKALQTGDRDHAAKVALEQVDVFKPSD